ncbi:monooxygenase [Plantactinospora sp. CA-290183]|uniref:monooxygenase n=1 Tax=Plantactinospora sp. CA-290183 TaxID=3240006 RepID=UPI003D90C76F
MSTDLAPAAHGSGAGTDQLRIAVIGGSLTGPVTALLLIQAGFDRVTVYEAAPASAPLTGGLIGLEHAALDVLDRLGIPQPEFVAHTSEVIMQMRVHDRRPAEIARRVYPGRNTTWTLLHRALAARLPNHVLRTGMRVTGLAEQSGQPVLQFADGHAERADLVVFGDGRSSIGRRLLDPNRRLRYAGYVAHRGTAECTPHPDLRDFLRLEPCPGVQFNLAPVPGGCDWTFYLDCPTAEYRQYFGASPTRRLLVLPQHVSPAARAHVDEHAEHLLPPEHCAVVHATHTRMAVPVLDIAPPTRMVWPIGNGHAALLGDALAPVRPHTARGANNGIEQAAGLVTALLQHHRYGADLPAALQGWQRRHLPAAVAAVHRGPTIGQRFGLGTA